MPDKPRKPQQKTPSNPQRSGRPSGLVLPPVSQSTRTPALPTIASNSNGSRDAKDRPPKLSSNPRLTTTTRQPEYALNHNTSKTTKSASSDRKSSAATGSESKSDNPRWKGPMSSSNQNNTIDLNIKSSQGIGVQTDHPGNLSNNSGKSKSLGKRHIANIIQLIEFQRKALQASVDLCRGNGRDKRTSAFQRRARKASEDLYRQCLRAPNYNPPWEFAMNERSLDTRPRIDHIHNRSRSYRQLGLEDDQESLMPRFGFDNPDVREEFKHNPLAGVRRRKGNSSAQF